VIRVENLSKRFGGTEVLRGLSFEVGPRTVLGVIGASGSGKSTLLRCLNGFERVSGGQIDCAGVRLEAALSASEYRARVSRLRRKVGTVFQHLYLFPHLSATGNVTEAPVHVLKVARREAESRARELLETVGLGHRLQTYPENLSGGEQQRVAIARALAMRPEVLLFDEPTSALDPRRTNELRAMLRGFADEGDHTMVVVTHSINFLKGFADSVLYMEGGQIVEHGPPEQVLGSPTDPRTREFIAHAG
jgi:polar amino acid transport system ATP-binding protein